MSSGGFVDNSIVSFSERRLAAGLTVDDVADEFKVPQDIARAWDDGRVHAPEHIGRTLDLLARHRTGEIAAPKTKKAGSGLKPRQPEFAATRDEGPLFGPKSLIKSKKRVADHGEVFTPDWLVEKMLDLVKGESERIDSRFLEPACGSGNFLVAVLKRKLASVEEKHGKQPFNKRLYALQALACCYGIELLADNIAECRANMLAVFAAYLGIDEGNDYYRAASHVLSLNLVHGDAMTMNAADGGPIMIVEWTYLGKGGKFNRRDFRLEALTQMSGFNERWATPDTEREESLFGEPRPAFHQRGRDPIFQPVGSCPPMTVPELAAKDLGEA